MKAIIKSVKAPGHFLAKMTAVLLSCILILSLPSCQKDEDVFSDQESVGLKCAPVNSGGSLFFGPVTFNRDKGAPCTEKMSIENQNFECYDNLVLKIQNGSNKYTRVSSAEVRIDGKLIAGPWDFSRNVFMITKKIKELTPGSILEVKLNSAPGSFIKIWIEGTLVLTPPLFTQIGPLVQDSSAPGLPAVSENGVTGTWSPETINTAAAGTFTYTFTPDAGQCASVVTMDIEVINRSTVTDAEGNVYATVKIGSQWWMADNLKTTRYNNGDLIGTTDPSTSSITGESMPKYQWAYKGFESRVETFGRLYTWFAATDTRGVCPAGWHLPSDADWATLSGFLVDNSYGYEGSGTDIGKSMASITDWVIDPTPGNVGNDQASNNSSGFNAFPGGYRLPVGSFNNGSYAGFWWSSNSGSFRALYSNSGEFRSLATSNKYGMSVRCVKD